MQIDYQRSILTKPYLLLILIPLILGLTKCEEWVVPFELIDPTPGAYDQFGDEVILLANGNIVVVDPKDSTFAPNNGAIHIYNPKTQALLNSFYGDVKDDRFGWFGVRPLSNGNFVVVAHTDDENDILNAGTIRLVNGVTGLQIGATITGDAAADYTQPTSVTELANGHFVISAPFDTENGVSSVGSVRIIDSTTGLPIGETLVGNDEHDNLGSGGITALANGNFVIASPFDRENGVRGLGSVRLIDGATGIQIGDAIWGDTEGVRLGSSGTTALANNNFVISSPHDNNDFLPRTGSVKLVSGVTAIQIGSNIKGSTPNARLGSQGTVALPNNNFVIVSSYDTENNIAEAGTIRLVDGNTGIQIGEAFEGDRQRDALGHGGITVLSNNNFVIASPLDDENGIVNAGSARLVDGTTGEQIGNTIVGESDHDALTSDKIIALPNDNFVIVSADDNEGGINRAGSIRLINGSSGEQIGDTIAGDIEGDQLGDSGVMALGNNNFVIASAVDDENGIVNAGSVRLIDGVTGIQIGETIAGNTAHDLLGLAGVARVSYNDFLILSPYDDVAGAVDVGSVRRISGTLATQIGKTHTGEITGDMISITVAESGQGDFYVLSLSRADRHGEVDSGFVRVLVW